MTSVFPEGRAKNWLFICEGIGQHHRVRLNALPLLSVLALEAAVSVACNSRGRGAAPATTAHDGKRLYGEALASARPIPVASLLDSPETHREAPVTVEGRVRKACTRRGCWMELAESVNDGPPGCRVTFKNYGFFVPTDAAGSHARVQGKVEVDTLPAASVRHYEEEGARFPGKQPDGTAREVRLVATGVELWRDP